MKLPSLLEHIFNPDSRKVGFGYQVFLWSTFGFLFAAHGGNADRALSADNWIICVGIAGALIGGGTIMDDKHAQAMAKLTGGNTDASASPSAAPAGVPSAAAGASSTAS